MRPTKLQDHGAFASASSCFYFGHFVSVDTLTLTLTRIKAYIVENLNVEWWKIKFIEYLWCFIGIPFCLRKFLSIFLAYLLMPFSLSLGWLLFYMQYIHNLNLAFEEKLSLVTFDIISKYHSTSSWAKWAYENVEWFHAQIQLLLEERCGEKVKRTDILV